MNMKKLCILLCLQFGLLAGAVMPGRAVDNALPLGPERQETADATTLSEKEIKAEIEALQGRIKSFQEAENNKVASSLGVTVAQLKERTEKAREIQVFYNRMLAALNKAQVLAAEKKTLQAAIASGEAFELAQLPPYSLRFYDEAAAKLDESLSSTETAQMSRALARKVLKNGRQRLKDAEQQLREIKAEAAAAKDSEAQLALQWKKGAQQLEVDYARAMVRYQELALANAESKLAISDLRTAVARQRLDKVQANLHFDAEDLQKQLDRIDENRAELQNSSDELLERQQKIEAKLLHSQKQLEKITDPEDLAEAKAEVEALESWRQACQRGLEQYEGALQLLNYQKEIWKQRYALLRGDAADSELQVWQKEAQSQQERIQQALALEQSQQLNLQFQISQVEKQLGQEDLSWTMKGHRKEQLEALKKMSQTTFAYLTTLTITNQMASRFIDEVGDALARNVLAEKAVALAAKIRAAWRLELMVVDDQSVTVGKVTIALFLLIFGIILSGHFTRALKRHVFDRSRLSESAAAITEKLLYYLTICVVVLLSMRVVNIPLTAFAFLGGAMAIGIGFGGQKIISNFISGFILMAEQPVKVGDLIQMADIVGKIEEIGARSTRVRTFANIHVLVPNSYFLENNIINWTHSDKVIRGDVTVGVLYGSPTKEVRRLLMLAVRDHKETLDYPKPYVFFNDFGDNALIFTIYFWITVQLINDKKRIESDVRFIIDDMFREAGIVIAFPQRDVHLDTSSPLRLEMVDSSEQGRQPAVIQGKERPAAEDNGKNEEEPGESEGNGAEASEE